MIPDGQPPASQGPPPPDGEALTADALGRPRFEIPIARRVVAPPETLWLTRPVRRDTLDPRLPAWRAVFELIMLVPAGFVGGMAGYMMAASLGVADEQWRLVASTIGMGTAAVCAAAMFVFIDHQRASDIGWTSRDLALNAGLGIAALVATYVVALVLFLIALLVYPALLEQQETAQKAVRERIPEMSLLQMTLFMLFVSIWEEVIFRGFVLTRLKSLLRRWWLAVPISSIFFGSVHIYEGALAVVMISILGLVMAGLLIWRKSLVPCITLHFLNNFVMLLLLRAQM